MIRGSASRRAEIAGAVVSVGFGLKRSNVERKVTRESSSKPLILLTGATGYIGGRLLKVLEKRGYPVVCLVRRPEFLKPKVGCNTEVVAGDVLAVDALEPALAGIHQAYYLVALHGAGGGRSKSAIGWRLRTLPLRRAKPV